MGGDYVCQPQAWRLSEALRAAGCETSSLSLSPVPAIATLSRGWWTRWYERATASKRCSLREERTSDQARNARTPGPCPVVGWPAGSRVSSLELCPYGYILFRGLWVSSWGLRRGSRERDRAWLQLHCAPLCDVMCNHTAVWKNA